VRHPSCAGIVEAAAALIRRADGMPMRAAIGEMARSYGPGTVEGAGDKGHQRFIVASDVCWK